MSCRAHCTDSIDEAEALKAGAGLGDGVVVGVGATGAYTDAKLIGSESLIADAVLCRGAVD